MTRAAHDAGALPPRRRRLHALPLAGLALALSWMALQLPAAEVRLMHAEAGVLRVAPANGVTAGTALQLQIQTASGIHSFELHRNDALGAIGGAGRAEAFRGAVANRTGSWAALTRIGGRWSGIWFDGRDFYGVEAAGALAGTPGSADQRADARVRAAAAPAGAGATPAGAGTDPAADLPMVFRLSDVLWDEHSFEDDVRHAPPGNGQRLANGLAQQALAAELIAPLAAGVDGPTHRLKVALVADSVLAARDGEALEDNLLALLNIVDGLFRSQLGVEVTTDSLTLFTRRDTDPFSRTDDAGKLLEELSNWRAGNAWQRQTALTHLFTGRDLERRTVGLAYLDTLCNRRYSASLSEARGPTTFAALIAAHEIAHVFGAPHDSDAEGACATTPAHYLMAPRINGSQQFSACSVAQIAPRVATAACLQRLDTGVPQPPVSPVTQGGGGGALAGAALLLLGLMTLGRARRRRLQMRANQSAR